MQVTMHVHGINIRPSGTYFDGNQISQEENSLEGLREEVSFEQVGNSSTLRRTPGDGSRWVQLRTPTDEEENLYATSLKVELMRTS